MPENLRTGRRLFHVLLSMVCLLFCFFTFSVSSSAPPAPTGSPTTASTVTSESNASEPAAIATPFAAMLTATKVDALAVDNNNSGKADPGDTLMYTVTITNIGDAPATG